MSKLRLFGHRVFVPTPGPAPILPGAGWSGATVTPAQEGTAIERGYDQTAIGNWTVPSWIDIATSFKVGVLGYHIITDADHATGTRRDGIRKVSFSVDNGAWVDVTSKTSNADSGLTDWNIEIVASNFTDAAHEIRAIIYPYVGRPRVLQGTLSASNNTQHSLVVNTNNGGTLPTTIVYVDSVSGNDTTGDGSDGTPYATAAKAKTALRTLRSNGDCGGCFIYAKAGSYNLSETTVQATVATRWFTFMPKPGVSKASVIVSGSSSNQGFRVQRLRVKGCTVTTMLDSRGTYACHLFAEDCTFAGLTQTTANTWPAYGSSRWVTQHFVDCTIGGYFNGPANATLVRNTTINGITSDALTNCRTNLKVTIIDITAGFSSHPDTAQAFAIGGTAENFIFYDITAEVNVDSQGPFIKDSLITKDIAIVDFQFIGENSGRYAFFIWGDAATTNKHIYVADSSFTSGIVSFGTTSIISDCQMLGVTFDSSPGALTGWTQLA
jgi:hypothetical protein